MRLSLLVLAVLLLVSAVALAAQPLNLGVGFAVLLGVGFGLLRKRGRPGSLLSHWRSRKSTLPRDDGDALGLRKIWESISRPGGPEGAFEQVLRTCQRTAGFSEVAVLRIDPRADELRGLWSDASRPEGPARGVRWGLGGVGGAIARAVRGARPIVACESESEELLTINGECVQQALRHGSFAVLPLLSPLPPVACLRQGWLHRDGCPSYEPHPATLTRIQGRDGGRRLDLGPCANCRHYPVHGLLVVSDAASGRRLTPSSLAALERITRTLGTVMEHASLYRDVKAAERFRDKILDAMRNGLISTDQHGRISFLNRRARELCGVREELRGRRLVEVLDFADGSALQATLVEGAASSAVEAHMRGEGVSHGSRSIPVRVSISPFRSEEGAMKGAVCVLEDLSTIRAMEQEIRHLDTLAAIGRFASSLAHEIRNPLAGIGAGMDFLMRSKVLGSEELQSLEVVQREVERLDGIIRDLLSVARPREMRLARLELAPLTRRVIRSLSALARERRVQMELRDSAVGEVHADRDMVHQILLNLVKNALELSSPGGRVEISFRQEGAMRSEPDPDGASDEGVCIDVDDEGPGVAEEHVTRLFEPFFSTKSSGTGLGLYVSHNFAERHGGWLRAQNRECRGARFSLFLPRVPALIGERHEAAHSGRR